LELCEKVGLREVIHEVFFLFLFAFGGISFQQKLCFQKVSFELTSQLLVSQKKWEEKKRKKNFQQTQNLNLVDF